MKRRGEDIYEHIYIHKNIQAIHKRHYYAIIMRHIIQGKRCRQEIRQEDDRSVVVVDRLKNFKWREEMRMDEDSIQSSIIEYSRKQTQRLKHALPTA